MDEIGVLNYWKSLIDDEETVKIWDQILNENDEFRKVPEGFFSLYRPDGVGLEKVFCVVKKGDKILKRILEIYEATSSEYSGCDWHFVIRKPKVVSEKELRNIAKEYISNVIQMAKILNDDYFDNFIKNPPRIEIVKGEAPQKVTDEYSEFDLDCGVYELAHEFIDSITPKESFALLFHEPLYQMTCSYDIVHYVLWPLYEHGSKISDPFKVFVEIWKLDAELRYNPDENIFGVYVKEIKDN